jgi:MFS family permease
MHPHSQRRFDTDKRLLLGARFFRSIAQGILAADFALYLRASGWNGAQIGTVLGSGLALAVALTLLAATSDRFGRKPFLVVYETLYALSCLAATIAPSAFVLFAAAVVGSFGRGANGAAGPFGAIEKAWLTQGLQKVGWTHVLSLNATLGFIGMAFGAGLGALPGLLHHGSAVPAGDYALIFPLALLASLACLTCIVLARDRHPVERVDAAPEQERAIRQVENRNLRNLGLVNLLQGTGIGLSGPLVSYWFAVRFGLGPAQIAPVMAGGFLAAAASAQLGARLTADLGLMRTIVPLRAAALLALVLMPLAPNPALAISAYLLNKTLNRGTDGLRASVTAGLVRNRRRGFAGAVTSISRQIPRSIGPLIAGTMMDSGWLAAPFLIGAGFQAAYLYLYQSKFDDRSKAQTEPRAVASANRVRG